MCACVHAHARMCVCRCACLSTCVCVYFPRLSSGANRRGEDGVRHRGDGHRCGGREPGAGSGGVKPQQRSDRSGRHSQDPWRQPLGEQGKSAHVCIQCVCFYTSDQQRLMSDHTWRKWPFSMCGSAVDYWLENNTHLEMLVISECSLGMVWWDIRVLAITSLKVWLLASCVDIVYPGPISLVLNWIILSIAPLKSAMISQITKRSLDFTHF